MGVIYLPVPTTESRGVAARFNDGRVAKGKVPHRVIECRFTGLRKWARRVGGHGALQGVGAAEKLYVVLHGIGRNEVRAFNTPALKVGMLRDATVGASQMRHGDGAVDKVYTFQQLAEHVEKEGLSKSHIDFRLFACSAGVPVPPPLGHGVSFAHEFREAMRQRGYAAMVVTAYLGDVTATYHHVLTNDPAMPRHPNPNLGDHTAQMFKGVQNAYGNLERASTRKVTFA